MSRQTTKGALGGHSGKLEASLAQSGYEDFHKVAKIVDCKTVVFGRKRRKRDPRV